ncbi:MAG TPA: putative DNA binding domain-containing protein [Ignavibacteriaceae bacterium]|nr:putative DNA binding domain-containing protein [Ignavibacteriaceae bacterium]
MSIEFVNNLLKQREKIRLEFKEARNSIPRNLFEKVCAFLNREGGSILLGVNNQGEVIGVDPAAVEQISTDISSLSNNPTKLNPPFILFPSVVEINGKYIIHIQVPSSSLVHKCDNIVFDRSSDGDFRVINPQGIAEIYNRKRVHFTEGTIYPHIQSSDFKDGLLEKVRNLIRSNKPNHPWLGLSDDGLFRTSGLYKIDYQSGSEGFTLAAVLLFGKDIVIKNILPHYKVDALVKIKDVDRYDDRLTLETNLIETYNELMDFAARHLPDKFHLEGDTRISLRERIFREIIANLIVHREYTNAHSATFTIFKDRVEMLNANNPNGSGPISISNFRPFPKNPIISKFFVQIGRVEELGSGIINVNKYLKYYSPGSKPEFIEDSVFKTIIPIKLTVSVSDVISATDVVTVEINDSLNEAISEALNDGINEGIIEGINEGIKNRIVKTVAEIKENEGIKAKVLADRIGVSIQTIERDISLIKSLALVEYKGSKKLGGYYLTDNLKGKLAQ